MSGKEKLRELFGIDIRSLALFRMGIALIILMDLSIRIQDLSAHYSDAGVLPRDVLTGWILEQWNISLHLISGTWQIQLILFILAAICAFAMLIGYHTRLATVSSWILLISLQTRNPLILQGGDAVLRLLVFWGMFLPLGAYWSVDQQYRKASPTTAYQIVSGGTVALLLQICFIYWFSALIKSDPSWRQDGTAIWYALSNELFATSIGKMLLQFPHILKISTLSTLYLEAFGPFLAFCPFWTGPIRTAVVVIFMFFHLVALNLTMELAHFTYVCAVAWLVFLPRWFWDKVMLPKKDVGSQWQASWFSNSLAIFFIIYVFLWNVSTLNVPILSRDATALGSLLRVDQYWNMFSPYPLREDGWIVIPGQLTNGSEVDLYTGQTPVNWNKPANLAVNFKNDRWRSYMMTFTFSPDNDLHLSSYAEYLCQQWNESHPIEEKLLKFDIVFMSKSHSIENPNQNYQKVTLWRQYCQAGYE